MPDDQPLIKPRDNGPLVARNVKSFRLPDGRQGEPKPVMALCRCGRSKNKPYCDGSHNDAEFDTAAQDVSHRDRVYRYEGRDAQVYFNKLLCSHAGECGRIAKEIFDTKAKPWIQPNNGKIEKVAAVVAACPSGALRMGKPGEEAQAITTDEVAIITEPNGPYHVTNISISVDYWAEGQSEKKYVLCRCGMSKNKPFCDGTHYDKEWREDP